MTCRRSSWIQPSCTSLSAPHAWSAERADEIACHCHGSSIDRVAAVDLWSTGGRSSSSNGVLPLRRGSREDPCAAAAYRCSGEPDEGRVVFDGSFGPYIGIFPADAGKTWFDSHEFNVTFACWRRELERRRDVFLGYSGASAPTAALIREFLEKDIGATVLDWQRDFKPGRSILEEIEEARIRCTLGIFLFTKDDILGAAGSVTQASAKGQCCLRSRLLRQRQRQGARPDRT